MLLGLDFDGTIADSWLSVKETLFWVASQDSKESVQRLESSLYLIEGKTLNVQLNSFIFTLDIEQARDLYMHFYQSKGLRSTVLNSGAVELLSYCLNSGVNVVVISAKTNKNLALSMSYLGLQDIPFFGDCDESKKSRLLKSLGVDLYLGDQESDVIAAQNANVKSIFFDSGKPKKTLRIEPSYRITQLNQTIEILDGLNILKSKN